MQFKAYNLLYFILTIWLITSCKTPIDPDFTFSPEMPKAGEKVVFTNLTESGELWDWSYGDGAKSRLKNPSYIYKKPGEYDISLMVDSNKNYVRTKKITVYDTIPSIYIKEEKVQYYQKVTLSALVYNPYGYEVDYQWSFSPNANSEDIVDGTSTASSLKVFFNQTEVEETVNLMLTVGDSIYQISKTFFVEDYPARSMVMAQKNGKILRKRMYVNGYEQSNPISKNEGSYSKTDVPAFLSHER
jgi:PKD repeat protein